MKGEDVEMNAYIFEITNSSPVTYPATVSGFADQLPSAKKPKVTSLLMLVHLLETHLKRKAADSQAFYEMDKNNQQQLHFEFPTKTKTSVRNNNVSPNTSSSTDLPQLEHATSTPVSCDNTPAVHVDHDLDYVNHVHLNDPDKKEKVQNDLANLHAGISTTVELSAENPTDPDLVQQQHMTSFSHTAFVSPTQENTAVAPIFNDVNNVLNMHLPTSVPAVSFGAVLSPPTELVRRDPNSSSPPTELVRREFNLSLPPCELVRREWTGLAKFTYF